MDKKQQTTRSIKRTVALILFSLLGSLLLWIYVTDTEGPEIRRDFHDVAVQFSGEATLRESRGLIVTNPTATSTIVTLTGNRRTISALESKDLTVSVDLSTITRTGSVSRVPQINYPSRIDTSAITTAATNPEVISFYVDILNKKTIELEGLFSGSVAEGFVADPLVFNPGTVILYGPEQVLAQVEKAFVEVTRTDVDRTLTFDSTFVLLDADGNEFKSEEITYSEQTVSVTLPVRAVKDVDLVVDFVHGGGATDANVRWGLEPDHIRLTGDSEVLAGVNNISVTRIDLSQIKGDSFSEVYRIVIPNDTEIISGATETTLRLELIGLYEKGFTIDNGNISCTNVTEGYAWEIVSDSLDVTIRGPQGAVESIDDVNIRAVANLTEYNTVTGIVAVPVRIVVDGNTEVGAVGEYTVYVNITPDTGAKNETG